MSLNGRQVKWSTYHQYVVLPSRKSLGLLIYQQFPPSFSVAGFPDYFLSLGIEHNEIKLQIVSLPIPMRSVDINEGHTRDDESDWRNTRFIPAGSIPLDSASRYMRFSSSISFSVICHQYRGRTVKDIRIWIGEDSFRPRYNVYTVSVDFSNPLEQWFTPALVEKESSLVP